jgi:hypothetical protein
MEIECNANDSRFLKTRKEKLRKGFNPKKEGSIDEANRLAVYLAVDGRDEEALSLLESYLPQLLELNGEHNAWSSIVRGGMLLAKLYRESGNQKFADVAKIINEHYFENAFQTIEEWWLFLKTDFEGVIRFYQKNGNYLDEVCTTAEYFMMFLYFEVILRFADYEDHKSTIENASSFVDELQFRIVECLKKIP